MQIVYKVQWFRDFNSKKSTESLGITKISIDENTGSRKKQQPANELCQSLRQRRNSARNLEIVLLGLNPACSEGC